MMTIKKKTSGFTLMEILITVAIIGILSSIAFPSYTHYVRKANASEIITTYELFKVHMMNYHVENGQFPENHSNWSTRNNDIGLEDKSAYESDIINDAWVGHGGVTGKNDVTSGHIAITVKDDGLAFDSAQTRFIAVVEKVGGRFIWYCNKRTAITKWASNIDDKYMPERCSND